MGHPLTRLTVAVLVIVALVFAWQAPSLPLDDLATRLRPGVAVQDICTGREENRLCLSTVVPDLESGDRLVIMADLGDEAFTAGVDALNDSALAGASVWVLSTGTAEEHTAFFWEWGPVFEVVEVPLGLIRPLYRTLPRSFETRDGVVSQTYAGLPPDIEAAQLKLTGKTESSP